jgi:hypothetical protein
MTIDRLKNKVFVFPEVQELEKLEKKQKMIDRSLRQMDDDLFDQELNLFKHDTATQFTENE